MNRTGRSIRGMRLYNVSKKSTRVLKQINQSCRPFDFKMQRRDYPFYWDALFGSTIRQLVQHCSRFVASTLLCSRQMAFRVVLVGEYWTCMSHTFEMEPYFIYLYTVKPSVYITIKSFITVTLFYKIAVWEPNRELPYSWSISLLEYPTESDFRRLRGNLFHNSAPL